MKSNHGDESDNQDIEEDDLMIPDQNEVRSKSNLITLEHSIDDVPVVNSHLYNNNDDDDESSQQTEREFVVDNNLSSPPNIKEISTALALFRHRHRLSKSCVNDLCHLLNCFGVKNVPSDFRAMERNLMQSHENILHSKKFIFCPTCGNKGNSSVKCGNKKCRSNTGFVSTPTTSCTFKLLPQIISILERHDVIPEPDVNDILRIVDVQQGAVRRDLVLRERLLNPQKKIVTFLLNSDGVVLKKFSRSVWVTCMVINELPRKIRFNINNIIICSISMGGTKPKKDQFQSFIADWVNELKRLELGFYVSAPNANGNFTKFHGYLIAGALDKPAQALLMNINDPTGYYSCVRCTIRGKILHFP